MGGKIHWKHNNNDNVNKKNNLKKKRTGYQQENRKNYSNSDRPVYSKNILTRIATDMITWPSICADTDEDKNKYKKNNKRNSNTYVHTQISRHSRMNINRVVVYKNIYNTYLCMPTTYQYMVCTSMCMCRRKSRPYVNLTVLLCSYSYAKWKYL